MVAVWFKGRELAFAHGINLSIGRLGSIMSSVLVPIMYLNHGLSYPLYVGLGVQLFSLINSFGLIALDKFAERRDGVVSSVLSDKLETKFRCRDITTFKMPYWLLLLSCFFTNSTAGAYFQISSDLVLMKNGLNPD